MFDRAAMRNVIDTFNLQKQQERRSPKENLVLAARKGDLDAFNDLVLTHQDSLYGWIYSMVQDHALAEDLTQAAFIAAYEKLSSFRNGSFQAWLYRIARNRSFDELRRRKRRPSISLDAAAGNEDDRELLSALPGEFPPPEEAVIQTQRAETVLELMEALPEVFRHVLQLVDMDGLDYREAADVLRLPLGTVKSRLARARLKFRALAVRSGCLSAL